MSPAKEWHIYLLLSERDDSYYVGITIHVTKRVQAHNEGKGAKRTRGRGPWILITFAPCASRSDALKKELKAKSLPRKEKLAFFDELRVQAYPRGPASPRTTRA